MRTRATTRVPAVAVALAVLGGCIYIEPPGGPPVGPGPVPAPVGATGSAQAGLSFSGGFFDTADSDYLNGLDSGFIGNLGVALRLSPELAVEFNFGATTLTDTAAHGGEMTVNPATVSAVFSLPDPYSGSQLIRYRLGIGAGTAILDHTEYDVENIGIFKMEAGSEWMLDQGGRLFATIDLYLGEEVWDETESWMWDLSSMLAIRLGVEMAF